MAFTRNFLKTMGLTDEQVSTVMEEHTAVTDALKTQRDGYKADAEKLATVQKELDALKGGKDYKAEYDKEHQAFEDYKAQVARDAETAKVSAAYRKLLQDERISPDWLDDIVKFTDFSGMKLGEDGNLQDADALKKTIGEKYAKYQVKTRERGPRVETPPKQDNSPAMGSIRQMGASIRASKYGALPPKEQQ